jgi:hypothetical protein
MELEEEHHEFNFGYSDIEALRKTSMWRYLISSYIKG